MSNVRFLPIRIASKAAFLVLACVLFWTQPAKGQGDQRAQTSRGNSAFQAACVQCHDAAQSLERRKSFSAWIATIRRMAAMDDANIRESDIIPIATYLTSLSQPQNARPLATDSSKQSASNDDSGDQESSENEDDSDDKDPESEKRTDTEASQLLDADVLADDSFSASATFSAIWLGGNDNLENPGFFPDAWLSGSWQSNGAIRAKVTACTSCHNDTGAANGFTFELVEAYAAVDLLNRYRARKSERRKSRNCCPSRSPSTELDLELKAGRFIVPFGAFASQNHPGIYRTATQPLMYNMGRQVNAQRRRPPVLPGPYSDEGVNLNVDFSFHKLRTTLDLYAVNGLQGSGPGVDFTLSRKYADNNSQTAIGGRGTTGLNWLRFGGSIMTGQMEDEGQPKLNYHLAGGDVMARFWDDDIRVYFEYAIRRNDSPFGTRQLVYGTVGEVEAILVSKPNLSLLARYDNLEHRDAFGSASIRRFTWGFRTQAFQNSNLIVNHEHWRFSDTSANTDLLAIRWIASF